MTDETAGATATAAEAAKHISIGTRRFRELVETGVIERQPSGKYDLTTVRLRYIEHLRRQAAGRAANGGPDLATERALLAKSQTEAQEMRNRIARGEFVEVEHVGLEVERQYAVVRERLLSMTGKLAAGLAGRTRAEIETALEGEVHAALAELSGDAVLELTKPPPNGAAPTAHAPVLPALTHPGVPSAENRYGAGR